MDLEFSVLKNRLQERMMADNISDADLKGWNLADMTKVTPHTTRTSVPFCQARYQAGLHCICCRDSPPTAAFRPVVPGVAGLHSPGVLSWKPCQLQLLQSALPRPPGHTPSDCSQASSVKCGAAPGTRSRQHLPELCYLRSRHLLSCLTVCTCKTVTSLAR